MAGTYPYFKVGSRYYLAYEQGPLAFLAALKGHSGVQRIGAEWERADRGGLGPGRALLEYLLRRRRGVKVVELPLRGNYCRRVHQGYKVFDTRRHVVGKVFYPEVKAAQVEREIDAVERAARLEFAPQVLSSNLAERWYEEELVEGVPGLPPGDLPHGVHVERFLEFFHREVLPCLEKVVLLEGVRFQDLGPYTDALSAAVTEERTDGGGSPERQAKVAAVRAYMASARSQLMAASDHDVLLQRVPVVFSHGDFEQNNLLRTKTGVRIIDWEAAGERSILYDLYNFFFYEIYCGRIEGSIVPQIDQAIAALVAHIEKQHPLLEREFLTHSSFSRRLFYLEWLCMVLGRDYKDKNLDVALRMIATYERFEKNAEQASPVASAAGQKCR